MRRNILDPVVNGRKAFADWTDAAKEESRRKREGVKNLLDREYAASFEARQAGDVTSEWSGRGHSLLIPFRFETNSTYRISFFIETEDVRPQSRHVFNGALIGIWTDRPQKWHFTYGNRAIIGSTGGRIAQSALIETGKVFETKGISVCLRGATGRMKVDGLIVEKVK